jgi:hypothetical protein
MTDLVRVLRRTIEALRSYQYGEPSRSLAREVADAAEAELRKMEEAGHPASR